MALRSALIGAIVTLLLLAAIAAVVVLGGFYSVAASERDPSPIAWLLNESMEHGVKAGAKGLKAPKLSQAEIREGGSHFKGMCQGCHGAPGIERGKLSSGMNPRPPNLARAADEWTVPQIFWIARNGIKMTGMPAFESQADDDELWKVAAFVKQLPKVSAEDYAAIPNAHQHGHGEGAAAHSH
jgi:mono/diheme cytochrome c family protein